MRTGILTFHDGPNHGAYLQAWATYQVLRQAGYESHVINYKNPVHRQSESRGLSLIIKNPIQWPKIFSKIRSFSKAQKKFKLGPIATDATKIDWKNYDAVVIGSDVVWNYKLFGFDPTFFGGFECDKKISYAASFGSVNVHDEHPQRMVDCLHLMDHISVRDQNSAQIVEDVLGNRPRVTLDPTLIYDFSGDVDQSFDPGSSLLVYSYIHTADVFDCAAQIAKKHNLETVCLGYGPPALKRNPYDLIDMGIDPMTWTDAFSQAHTVITSTYHGVVFSIKNFKPFVFVSNARAYNRVSSLLDNLEIEHQLTPQENGRLHNFFLDYSKIRPTLETLVTGSRDWLLSRFDVGKR